MVRRDDRTLDLFRDVEPPAVVARYDEELVRAATLSARMSRAVAQCLKDSSLSREKIAAEMASFLGEDVPVSVLNAYASQAKDKHQISAVRLLALAVVTKDEALINALLGAAGLIAVPSRYEALLKRERARERRERAELEEKAADAQWQAARR
jgi:hypothetical protein